MKSPIRLVAIGLLALVGIVIVLLRRSSTPRLGNQGSVVPLHMQVLQNTGLTSVAEDLESVGEEDDEHDANVLGIEDLEAEIAGLSEDKLYIEPNFDLVLPEFKSKQRMIVDFPFHHFTDAHGISDCAFNKTHLVELLREVSNVWIKGNIYVRFKIGDVLKPYRLPDCKADAYKWWVVARKAPGEAGKADYNRYLLRGAGQSSMSPGAASLVAKRLIKQYNGHALLNWILNIGPVRGETHFHHIYSVYFYHWYNGGTTRGRIFARCGSCQGRAKILKDGTKAKCAGDWDQGEPGNMHPAEFVRVLAHEIGHSFDLQHGNKQTCQIADRVEDMLLMRQQAYTTTKAQGNCRRRGGISKFARLITSKEFKSARTHALKWMKIQSDFYQLHPELVSSQIWF